MASTKTIIISNALGLLGKAPITTLDEGDDITVAAEQAYDLLLPAVLAENNWRFATQIQQLSETTEEPPDPWKTIYLLPAGFLKTIRVIPQIYDWELYAETKLYTTHSGKLHMEYTFVPDASRLPNYFQNYFIYEIASHLALSNAQRPEYEQRLEAKRLQKFAMACAINSQNRPQNSQVDFPVLSARNAGSSGIATEIDN